MEKWGRMGQEKGARVDVCLLCYFVLLIVFYFAQEHYQSWLGMGMDIVLCPLLS